jgi:hypothetical protein
VSPTKSTEKPVVYSKPQPNVYTMLLVIALLALIVGIVFLYQFMSDYQFKIKDPRIPPISQVRESSGLASNRVQGSGFRMYNPGHFES